MEKKTIYVVCNECGNDRNIETDGTVMFIDPCPYCIGRAEEKGYENGKDSASNPYGY
jgi:hypothetical protein